MDRLLEAGPADDPRRVLVESKKSGVDVPFVSTPGARVRVRRTHRGGDVGRFLLWAHRRGIAVELAEGPADEILVDGIVVSAEEARRRLA